MNTLTLIGLAVQVVPAFFIIRTSVSMIKAKI
jgi:hypothetical protein